MNPPSTAPLPTSAGHPIIPPGADGPGPLERPPIAALLLLALTCLAFFPAFHAGYVWDDDVVKENYLLNTFEGLVTIWTKPGAIALEAHYWPLTYTTFWIETQLFGQSALVYHTTNILLHALNSFLLFLLLRRLHGGGALLAAGFFAVHPVHVESVAWIIERKDVLSGVFALGSLLLLCGAGEGKAEERPRAGWLLGALLCYGAGLLSKSSILAIPLVGLMLVWAAGRRLHRGHFVVAGLMLVLGAAFCVFDMTVVRKTGGDANFDYPLGVRFAIAGGALWFYLWKLALPWPLLAIYTRWEALDWSPLTLGYPIACIVAVWLAWHYRDRIGRWPLAMLTIFGMLHGPTLGFVDHSFMGYSFVADRFQYLACAAPLALLAGGIARGAGGLNSGRRRRATWLGILITIGWGAVTWHQCTLYESSETLFAHVLRYSPENPVALNNCAAVKVDRGAAAEAEPLLRRSVELMPTNGPAWDNLGSAMRVQGKLDRAILYHRRGLYQNSRMPGGFNNLGVALSMSGKRDMALMAFREAARQQPGWDLPRMNIANSLVELNRPAEAVPVYEQLVAEWPRRLDYKFGLAYALEQSGKEELALAKYLEVLRADPGVLRARASAANLLHRQKRAADAIALIEEGVRVRPNSASALQTLAEAREKLFGYAAALETWEQGVRRFGLNPEFHYGRAATLAALGRTEEAIEGYRRAMELRTPYVQAANNLAWILAAHPEERYRSPNESIKLAQLANEATAWRSMMCIDTLAVAYAAAGRFEDAESSATTLLRMVLAEDKNTSSAIAEDVRGKLRLFQQRKAYRDATLAPAAADRRGRHGAGGS